MSKKVRWILFAFLLLVALYFVTGEVVSRCIGMDGKIDFYGKVIDPDGNPVGNARITYLKVTAFHLLPFSRFTHGPMHEVKSDSRGIFHIKGGRGMSLSIEAIKKEGFRLAQDGNSLSYSFGSSSDPHRPDPKRPVEFLLIPSANKRLEPLVDEVLRFKWNSGPIKVIFGNEVLIIRPTRDRLAGERSGFAWNVNYEVKDGEILLKDKRDRLPLAPLGGYQKFVDIGSTRNSPNWVGGVSDRILIFKTSQGLYGKIKIDFYSARDDDRVGGFVSIFQNPTGGRYLD